MTDPYEYLLSKLNVIIIPEFTTATYSIYKKLEIGKKIITNCIPLDWTHEQIFKLLRNIDLNSWFRQNHNKETDCFCRQLQQFPVELESIEHVDLLLTLNGLQTSDEISC